MAEASAGKDTTTGHWELAGLISPQAMPVFPNGFPEEVLRPFEEATGRGVLCNRPYSGTQVIREYGEEHLQSGKWIEMCIRDRSGAQIRGLILPGEQVSGGANIRYIEGDVRNAESLEPLFEGLEDQEVYVIHTAGIIRCV